MAAAYSRVTVTRGVVATAATFMMYFLISLIIKSFGMLLLSIRDDFDTDTWIVGTVFSLFDSITDLTAPFVGPIGIRFGYRTVSVAGAVMASTGLIAVSQAPSFPVAATLLVVLVATGRCLSFILVCTFLAEQFADSGFALASGISRLGTGIGLICVPSLVQLWIDTYGWRGTMLILGSASANMIVCGALIVSSQTGSGGGNRHRDYQSLSSCSLGTSTDEKSGPKVGVQSAMASLQSKIAHVSDALGLSVMKDFDFWNVTIISAIGKTTFLAWVIYFVPHAVSRGFTAETAAVMVTIAGVGFLLGTIFSGWVVYKGWLSSTNCLVFSVPFSAVPFFVDALMNTSWLMTVNAVVVLVSFGCQSTMMLVVLKEALGHQRFASALGWSTFFCGTFRLLGGFIPGWAFDHNGSYDVGFVIIGAIQLTPLIPTLLQLLYRATHNSL